MKKEIFNYKGQPIFTFELSTDMKLEITFFNVGLEMYAYDHSIDIDHAKNIISHELFFITLKGFYNCHKDYLIKEQHG